MASKIFLGANAFIFIGYGLACLASPSLVADNAGLAILNGDGSAELRAMYGGLQTAVGMLSLAALLRPELKRAVLFFYVFLFFGLASARMLGALMAAGDVGVYTWAALAFEAVWLGVAYALLVRGGREGEPVIG